MVAKTYRFDGTLLLKIWAIEGVRAATNLGLEEAFHLVEDAYHSGVILTTDQADTINAGLEFVEFEKNKDRPSCRNYLLVKAPRLIAVGEPLDLSDTF